MKFKNKYLNKLNNDMQNNIYMEALLKSFGTKSDVEIKDSLTLQGDFGKIIDRMLDDMLKIALKKDIIMP